MDFQTKHKNELKASTRDVKQAIEGVQNNIEWTERNFEIIWTWLKKTLRNWRLNFIVILWRLIKSSFTYGVSFDNSKKVNLTLFLSRKVWVNPVTFPKIRLDGGLIRIFSKMFDTCDSCGTLQQAEV